MKTLLILLIILVSCTHNQKIKQTKINPDSIKIEDAIQRTLKYYHDTISPENF